MVGAIYAYFVSISVAADLLWQVLMIAPFIFLCALWKQSKNWSYFGSISSSTCLIVVFGYASFVETSASPNDHYNDYVLLRIQQNALGVLIGLALAVIGIPTLAVDLLKLNVHDTIVQTCQAVQKMHTQFNKAVAVAVEPELAFPSSHVLTVFSSSFISKEMSKIRSNLFQQPVLIDQSAMELLFLFRYCDA